MDYRLNVHALLPGSRANGPGSRFVVWLQGCARRCPGCFNPDTHPFAPRRLMDPEQLWREVEAHAPRSEGVTVSGGEPLAQAPALAEFLAIVRARSSLSIAVFTGYELTEIPALPGGRAVLAQTDLLVAGPYRQELHWGKELRGSSNQQVHFLTPRYRQQDLAELPSGEVLIGRDGSVIRTGLGGFGQLTSGG